MQIYPSQLLKGMQSKQGITHPLTYSQFPKVVCDKGHMRFVMKLNYIVFGGSKCGERSNRMMLGLSAISAVPEATTGPLPFHRAGLPRKLGR